MCVLCGYETNLKTYIKYNGKTMQHKLCKDLITCGLYNTKFIRKNCTEKYCNVHSRKTVQLVKQKTKLLSHEEMCLLATKRTGPVHVR